MVVAGPSGVGKGTLIRGLRERHDGIEWSVSCTTRDPRPGEVDGRDYHFVDRDEFLRMARENELLEWAVVHAHDFYGTPRAAVEEALAAGRDMVIEIDYQGARSMRAALPEAVLVFVAPPSIAALRDRLTGRNTEAEDA
ncbi:MAG: guanylate kinase, partial [Armatimonadia bacterium]|nr:guanylate kinase [Armatimonadia bacterium]